MRVPAFHTPSGRQSTASGVFTAQDLTGNAQEAEAGAQAVAVTRRGCGGLGDGGDRPGGGRGRASANPKSHAAQSPALVRAAGETWLLVEKTTQRLS